MPFTTITAIFGGSLHAQNDMQSGLTDDCDPSRGWRFATRVDGTAGVASRMMLCYLSHLEATWAIYFCNDILWWVVNVYLIFVPGHCWGRNANHVTLQDKRRTLSHFKRFHILCEFRWNDLLMCLYKMNIKNMGNNINDHTHNCYSKLFNHRENLIQKFDKEV